MHLRRNTLLAPVAALLVVALGAGRAQATVSATAAASTRTAGIDLTGTWIGGCCATGVYEITQSGKTITWSGHSDDGHSWANDFKGTIQGADIAGTFQDRPGFDAFQHGSVTVHIDDACHLSFVSASVPWGTGTWTKEDCALPVPIDTVSNGCGGEGWTEKIQNYFGNTSKFSNSNLHPFTHDYLVSFEDACNLHDAGYAGAIVYDKINGVVKDYRTWSRAQVDKEFLDNMRKLCERQIPAAAKIALANCKSRGGNVSFGAETRFNLVRKYGGAYFDADLSQPGVQSTGPRANN